MKELNEMNEFEVKMKLKQVKANLKKLRSMRAWGFIGSDEPVGDVIKKRVKYKNELEARLKELRNQNKQSKN